MLNYATGSTWTKQKTIWDVFRQYDSAMLVFFIYTVSTVYAFDHRFIVEQILFMQYYYNVAWAYYKLRH